MAARSSITRRRFVQDTLRIRDVTLDNVRTGRNWRVRSDDAASIIDWGIEECDTFKPDEYIVYSAVAVFESGEVRPLLLIRELGSSEWWGDTCEFVNGAWRELEFVGQWNAEVFVANPLKEDLSFTGEYSHDMQREGFSRYRDRLGVTAVLAVQPPQTWRDRNK